MASPGAEPRPQPAVDGLDQYVNRGDIRVDGDNNTIIIQNRENVAEVSSPPQTQDPPRSGWGRASQITGVILLLIVGAVAYLVLLGVLDSTALSATLSVVGTLAAIVALIFFSGQ
jgi:hypothetical protein